VNSSGPLDIILANSDNYQSVLKSLLISKNNVCLYDRQKETLISSSSSYSPASDRSDSLRQTIVSSALGAGR